MTKICTSVGESKRLLKLGLSESTAIFDIENTELGEIQRVSYSSAILGIREPGHYPGWSLESLLELLPDVLGTKYILTIRGTNIKYEDNMGRVLIESNGITLYESIINLLEKSIKRNIISLP